MTTNCNYFCTVLADAEKRHNYPPGFLSWIYVNLYEPDFAAGVRSISILKAQIAAIEKQIALNKKQKAIFRATHRAAIAAAEEERKAKQKAKWEADEKRKSNGPIWRGIKRSRKKKKSPTVYSNAFETSRR